MSIDDMRRNGSSAREIRANRSAMTKVRHGVYSADSPEGTDLYRLKCEAALAALAPGATLAGPSAAAVTGLWLLQTPSVVYVRGITRGRYGKDVGVIGDQAPRIKHDGLAVTAHAWTVADCARILGKRDGLMVADSATHLQRCSVEELRAVARELGPVKGVSVFRWVVENVDPLAESPGETWLRMIAHELGLPTVSQVTIEAAGARVDLLIDGTKIVLEFDGLIKYDGTDPKLVKATIKAERMRQGRLEALGYLVIRFIWEQLSDLETIKKRLQYAMRPTS